MMTNLHVRSHPVSIRDDDDRFVPVAAEIGAVASRHARAHDREATFVAEAYEAMRDAGYLRLAVPEELGGFGASLRQVCYAQAELARHDGATALAVAMHLHSTLSLVFNFRHGDRDAEAVLRQVAPTDLVIATSGGSDWLWPDAVATVNGDTFQVSGRKTFCSQAPAAGVVMTSAVQGEPRQGAEVLHFAVPLDTEGVRIEETWDTLGMRGTASHDLVLEDVEGPREKIVARRPWGELGIPLAVAVVHGAPVIGATYFGIAAGARDVAVELVGRRPRGGVQARTLPGVHRQVGLMDARLRSAWWALSGSVDELGADYACGPATVSTVMIAKRDAVMTAVEVVSLAMDVAGGRAYFRSSPIERAYRDVRAGLFHPLTPEETLAHAGRVALDIPT
ncbi:acyl-CoA dehydrogenase family protein [Acrocarpospora sp. B8E8]|uniref:acyl-CoA dehydrogenase family protein n=1 Tax=Acrocarpospora sp. B8E8 TaxID=3153572 RepID=UPI00325E4781